MARDGKSCRRMGLSVVFVGGQVLKALYGAPLKFDEFLTIDNTLLADILKEDKASSEGGSGAEDDAEEKGDAAAGGNSGAFVVGCILSVGWQVCSCMLTRLENLVLWSDEDEVMGIMASLNLGTVSETDAAADDNGADDASNTSHRNGATNGGGASVDAVSTTGHKRRRSRSGSSAFPDASPFEESAADPYKSDLQCTCNARHPPPPPFFLFFLVPSLVVHAYL